MRRYVLILGVLILGILAMAVPALAIEPPDAYKPRLPAEPLYLPDQALRIAEPDSGTVLIPPARITVHFRTFEFDLVPGSLELWVDGVEKTEELEFADDRAWWEVPDPASWSPGDHEIEADITDYRMFSEEQATTRLEAFFEALEAA